MSGGGVRQYCFNKLHELNQHQATTSHTIKYQATNQPTINITIVILRFLKFNTFYLYRFFSLITCILNAENQTPSPCLVYILLSINHTIQAFISERYNYRVAVKQLTAVK